MLIVMHSAVLVLFLVLAALFFRGKGSGLIAGYNTASAWEKRHTDERKLTRFMGRLMLALAVCWVPVLLSAVLDAMWLHWLGLALFLAVTVAGVVYANTGKRFWKP